MRSAGSPLFAGGRGEELASEDFILSHPMEDKRFIRIINQNDAFPLSPRAKAGFIVKKLFTGASITMKILILGVNGFIGNALTRRILTTPTGRCTGGHEQRQAGTFHRQPRFHFLEGDTPSTRSGLPISSRNADVVLPLVAMPPRLLRAGAPAGVRAGFRGEPDHHPPVCQVRQKGGFSLHSEVYGLCPEAEFDEKSSPLVLGPIHKERWIYSCAKTDDGPGHLRYGS